MNTGTYGKIIVALDGGAKLIVRLDGDAKLAHGSKEGHYTLASTAVNGKQYWIQDQGSNAIWYDKKFKKWRIGDKQYNGTSTSSLHSTDDALISEKATSWNYWNEDGGWMSTSNMFGSLSTY